MTFLGVGITVFNVWDLPLWAWRDYARIVDRQRAKALENPNR